MRTGNVALGAQAEELAFDRIAIESSIDRLGEDGVERAGEALPRTGTVDRALLRAIRNPDVGDARCAERAADRGSYLAAGDSVVDPEPSDPWIGVRQRVPTFGQSVSEKSGIEVHADPPGLRPV